MKEKRRASRRAGDFDADIQRTQTGHILCEIERLNALMLRLAEKGSLSTKDVAIVELQVTLKRAERKAKVLRTCGVPSEELEGKISTLRQQLEALGATA